MIILFEGINWNDGNRVFTEGNWQRLPNNVAIDNVRDFKEAQNGIFLIFGKEFSFRNAKVVNFEYVDEERLMFVDILADYDSVPI